MTAVHGLEQDQHLASGLPVVPQFGRHLPSYLQPLPVPRAARHNVAASDSEVMQNIKKIALAMHELKAFLEQYCWTLCCLHPLEAHVIYLNVLNIAEN
jgi:hypothetical protein